MQAFIPDCNRSALPAVFQAEPTPIVGQDLQTQQIESSLDSFPRLDGRKRHEAEKHRGKKRSAGGMKKLARLFTAHPSIPSPGPSAVTETNARPAVASRLPNNGDPQGSENIVSGHPATTVEVPRSPGSPAEARVGSLWAEVASPSWMLDPVWGLPLTSGIGPVHAYSSCWNLDGTPDALTVQPSAFNPSLDIASEIRTSSGSELWGAQDRSAEGNRPVSPTESARLSNNVETMARVHLPTAVESPVSADLVADVSDDWLLGGYLASPSQMIEWDWSLPVSPDSYMVPQCVLRSDKCTLPMSMSMSHHRIDTGLELRLLRGIKGVQNTQAAKCAARAGRDNRPRQLSTLRNAPHVSAIFLDVATSSAHGTTWFALHVLVASYSGIEGAYSRMVECSNTGTDGSFYKQRIIHASLWGGRKEAQEREAA
ncbi:hypothetical protein LTR15_005949 [Elasticomyces elasticus]|nr:hypothetical protein LTR15_005949 [Elasticomyces elasticus]